MINIYYHCSINFIIVVCAEYAFCLQDEEHLHP